MDQPYAVATIREDGRAEITISGNTQAFGAPTVVQARETLVSYLAHRARPLGSPIRVIVDEPEGRFDLTVDPDGSVSLTSSAEPPEHDTIPPGQRPPSEEPTPDDPAMSWGPPEAGEQAPQPQNPKQPSVAGTSHVPNTSPPHQHAVADGVPAPQPAPSPIPPVTPAPATNGWPTAPGDVSPWSQGTGPQQSGAQQPSGWSAPPQQPAQPMTRRQMRESFLKAEQTEAPASKGFRGAMSKVGVRMQPSAAERAERDDIHAVSQHWPGVRTIAVANGKGGSTKTPATALLAAAFARYSGAATIAWDNNETRGTLGWRTEQGKHDSTVLDLIPRTAELLEPGARAGDISHFVHHQAADKYDVLRSNPNLLSAEQRISAEDVDAIHDVLGRYYRLIFVDSGNDESAPHWLRMIDKADQLVVPTIAKPEHAEAGALLLEALTKRGGRSAELAQRAVVIVSQAREKDVNPSAAEIARGFEGWVSDVVTIPYDRAMVESVLRFDALAPATRRAWLRAAAAVARRL